MDWRREARRALREYPRAKKRGDRRIVRAVETAIRMQRQYYNGEARLKMMELVYFRQTHTLAGSAVETEYSIETVRKWNLEIIAAVYVGLMYEPGE